MNKRVLDAQRGQATPEWIGLILLVSLVMLSMSALGIAVPGLAVGEAIASKLVCAAGLGDCASGPEKPAGIELAYGDELAELVASHAPELRYEDGMHLLPVDFRTCRQESCSDGSTSGEVDRSFEGEPVTAFTHVIDCRSDAPDPAYDCSGDRAGSAYVQYFLYWPSSDTAGFGPLGEHADDWESFQLRVDSSGSGEARASAHHGYEFESNNPTAWGAESGKFPSPGWGEDQGTYYISGGSHAGHVRDTDVGRADRFTPGSAITLVPIESLSEKDLSTEFAITPPWTKPVYDDPESEGT